MIGVSGGIKVLNRSTLGAKLAVTDMIELATELEYAISPLRIVNLPSRRPSTHLPS